jgi:mono/diheme cytochrome c family protein/DNA-binding beta-propeller fold protein YncE
VLEGSTVARAPSGDALYIADEDHRVLRVVALPVDPAAPARVIALPGAPAQIVALDDQVLVTIRDPGLLVMLRPDAASGLVETARVALPADAWGLAVARPAGGLAVVTSAWTHAVSGVSLATAKKLWSVDVPREPRGVVIGAQGRAYVTHLVGSKLTRIDDVTAVDTQGAGPRVTSVELPASPLRTPSGRLLGASLGYAATLSDDGARLFVARHALGALGKEAWFGASTVDVLLTATDAPLAPRHGGKLPFMRADKASQGDEVRLPGAALAPFTQPRAIVYRKSTGTLLVVGEGDDVLVELDAMALDPTLSVLRTYALGSGYDPVLPVASACAAPSGLAVSADEQVAWVFCRGTYDVAEVRLDPNKPDAPFTPAPPKVVHLADDPVDAFVSVGRRLFYNATDRVTSGGVGCAGCHPDGRDDGFVWHEAKLNSADGTSVNFVGTSEDVPDEDHVKGYPRRTPMLAGRVQSPGSYGWHAESPTIEDRLEKGFGLHRWGALPKHELANLTARAGYLVAFLRKGLVPPPRDEHAPTAEEQRGHEIFTSDAARCAKCHVPASGYTDRTAYPLGKLPKGADFDDEAAAEFKTPSLLFVGGHAPYFHDGSAASLEDLVEKNGDRMGHTGQLSKPDKAALIAFLRTL